MYPGLQRGLMSSGMKRLSREISVNEPGRKGTQAQSRTSKDLRVIVLGTEMKLEVGE